jgi:RNA polymerase sigma factor (sigma-70 family)
MRPRVRVRQEALLATLNEQYRAPLFNFFRRRVGDSADAEDLTQDTFVRLLALAEQESVDDPRALLFKIAGNLIKDRYRTGARRREARITGLEPAPISVVTREFVEEQDPEHVFIARERV